MLKENQNKMKSLKKDDENSNDIILGLDEKEAVKLKNEDFPEIGADEAAIHPIMNINCSIKKKKNLIKEMQFEEEPFSTPKALYQSNKEKDDIAVARLPKGQIERYESYNKEVEDLFNFNILDKFEAKNGYKILDYLINRLKFDPKEKYDEQFFKHMMFVFNFSDLKLEFKVCGPSKYDRIMNYVKSILKLNIFDKIITFKNNE